jgi:hypothetical protein
MAGIKAVASATKTKKKIILIWGGLELFFKK